MNKLLDHLTLGHFLKFSSLLLLFLWWLGELAAGSLEGSIFGDWGLLLCAIGLALKVGHVFILRKTLAGPPSLVTNRGLYRSIRHPIYLGDLFLLSGLSFLINHWGHLVLWGIGVYGILQQCWDEDEDLAKKFPSEFKVWKEKTRLLLPRYY